LRKAQLTNLYGLLPMTTDEEFDIQPLNDNILIKMEEPKTVTDGGIHLPNQEAKPATRQYQEPVSTVLAIPSDAPEDYPIKVGDKIIARGGNVVMRGQDKLVFIRKIDIIAVMKRK